MPALKVYDARIWQSSPSLKSGSGPTATVLRLRRAGPAPRSGTSTKLFRTPQHRNTRRESSSRDHGHTPATLGKLKMSKVYDAVAKPKPTASEAHRRSDSHSQP